MDDLKDALNYALIAQQIRSNHRTNNMTDQTTPRPSQLSTYEQVQIAIAKALADSDRTPDHVVRVKASLAMHRTKQLGAQTQQLRKEMKTDHVKATGDVVPDVVKAAVKKGQNNAAAFTRKSFGGPYQMAGNNYRRVYPDGHALSQGVHPDHILSDAHALAAQTKKDMTEILTGGADDPQTGWSNVLDKFREDNGDVGAIHNMPPLWADVEKMIQVRVEVKQVKKEARPTQQIMEAMAETQVLEALDSYGRVVNQIESSINTIWLAIETPREKLSKTSFRKPIKDLISALAYLPNPRKLAAEQLSELNALLTVVQGVVGKNDESQRAVHGHNMTDAQWKQFLAAHKEKTGRDPQTMDGWIDTYQNLFAIPAEKLDGIVFASRAPNLAAEQARLDADTPEGAKVTADFKHTQAYVLKHPKIQKLKVLREAAAALPRPYVGG